jgi:ABC-type multidrug transport system fused ATPase/permease subunit
VLKNITLSIPAGSHVGICSRTGSGKSTLFLSISRLAEITSGSLTIDNVDVSTLRCSTLRERLVAIPQTPELFPGTLRSNLDPLEQCSDAEIEEALRKVELGEVVEARGGLGAEAGKTPLSHGEHQLFGLACALLRRRGGGDAGLIGRTGRNRSGGILVLG